jgi:DNA-binding beta-propeller fold protein YncE
VSKTWLLFALALLASPSGFRTPAGTEISKRTQGGAGTVLPGGRRLSPYGQQFETGPGPFGLAISPSGERIATANGGPDRFSLSVLEKTDVGLAVKTIRIGEKRTEGEPEDDWKSAFMGLAFDGERTLYASEGESGAVRVLDPATGERRRRFDLDGNGFHDSYSGDLALDAGRGLLYVVDQANFRVAIFDVRKQRYLSSVRVGRLPFAMALSPDSARLYVTNVGMFAYKTIPGADATNPRETGLPFPAFGFPSKESLDGVMRMTVRGPVPVPGLGDPNTLEANSLCVVDVSDPAKPAVVKFIRTGLPFGPQSVGGSSPAGVLAAADRVFVSNSANDSVSIIDAASLALTGEVALRIPNLEKYRGVLPIGLAYDDARKRLLVAEAGINAIGVIDAAAGKLLGHIPAGWFPTRVAVRAGVVYVTNAKGHGIGPNATLDAPLPGSFQAERRRGTLSIFELPEAAQLARLTDTALSNNGFLPRPDPPPLPAGIRHVVIIVKENRTFDEVLGDVAGAPKLARYGRRVTPNQHALAEGWAMSDNFYADSEVSVDGHHWLVGSYPNAWTESTLMAAYGGQKKFRLTLESPGRLEFPESNSSVHPEDLLEAGTLWHHLDRNGVTFRNFGEGFELAGVDEGPGLKPTGARYLTNVPMPEPLYRNTSRAYPNFNMNIPDQFRAAQFIAEMEELYGKPRKPLPQLLFIHLPGDHTDKPRPQDGYASRAAYVADNDYALGRILEYLSHSGWWRNMVVFVTEDDAQGGVDHVDAHRTVLSIAGPYIKKGYVSHQNTSFPGLLKTAFRLLRLPPLNLFDAAATDLGDCFTDQPDFKPYRAAPIDPQIFDPAKAREPLDPRPGAKMDDPAELRRQHRKREK